MKQAQLRELQPLLWEQFSRILQQGRLGHAYLFSGSFASFEMALFLSQALFCGDKQDGLPCEHCRNCRLVAQQELPDMTIVAPQGNLIKTESIRELVKDFSQSGFESTCQVFIIRDAEKMHPNAANSLLKAIEEPQSDIHIFLLTNQEEAVLPTIKSRTQIVAFPKNKAYLENLLEQEGILKTQARLLAELAGSPEEAKVLGGDKQVLDLLSQTKKFVDTLFGAPMTAYLQVPQLVQLVPEKIEQERLFSLLILLLSERIGEKTAQTLLESVLEARQMWRSNVSLQNALEYWILNDERKR